MIRATRALAVLMTGGAVFVADPAAAQMHDMHGMHMPGMAMPATPAAKKPAAKKPARAKSRAVRRPTRKPPAVAAPTKRASSPEQPVMQESHAAMPGMAMPGMEPGMTMPSAAACPSEHAAMGHCTLSPAPGQDPTTPVGTDQPAGNAPPPAPPTTLAAARFYDPATMAAANRAMRDEHGGMRFSQILFNLAEVQVRNGRDGYRWDGEGWFGGDIHRLVVKSEGEGDFGRSIESAEVQALYAKAIDPYWNLQAGVRQDLGSGAKRTYAVVGVEGLAPYWFDVEGSVFLSNTGDVLARAEAWYDQRITQRLVLQPRVELNLAAQDVPASRIGAGLSSTELGLRLRYEFAREFAPYVGLSYTHANTATARYSRARRERSGDRDTGGLAVAVGIRGWF
ncbi:copper resistance protein B [Sphingomonas sp. BK036]|uniref:copper resistance protein B n=1 Tax=Sphingomonas sp. BK036 TaxID=2512122 RepID=UPI0010F206F0|nr:copper resistance protein B [Sphingomonas sp. BK036]RZT54940.1 copper resistance protein B [Sphingomonas sp. BK036]